MLMGDQIAADLVNVNRFEPTQLAEVSSLVLDLLRDPRGSSFQVCCRRAQERIVQNSAPLRGCRPEMLPALLLLLLNIAARLASLLMESSRDITATITISLLLFSSLFKKNQTPRWALALSELPGAPWGLCSGARGERGGA